MAPPACFPETTAVKVASLFQNTAARTWPVTRRVGKKSTRLPALKTVLSDTLHRQYVPVRYSGSSNGFNQSRGGLCLPPLLCVDESNVEEQHKNAHGPSSLPRDLHQFLLQAPMEVDGEVNASNLSGSKNPWDRFLESARYLKRRRHSFPHRQPYPIPSDQLYRVPVYPRESNDEAIPRTGVWVDLSEEDEPRLNMSNTVLLGLSQRNFKSNQRGAIQASWLSTSTFSKKSQIRNVPLCHQQDPRVREADTAASPGLGRVPLASLSNASSLLPPRSASQAKKVNHICGNTTRKTRSSSSPRTPKTHRNIIVQLQLNKSASAPRRKQRTRADKSVALRTCPYAGCESAGDAHTMWCHLKTVHCVGDTTRCPFESCDSIFSEASSVRRHVMAVHWKAPGIFDVCTRCGMVQRTDMMSLHVPLCEGEADQGNES